MSLLAFWIGVAVLIGLDYAMGVWIHLPHRWMSHSIGSVVGAFVSAWGVWLVVGRFGGLGTAEERRLYPVTRYDHLAVGMKCVFQCCGVN